MNPVVAGHRTMSTGAVGQAYGLPRTAGCDPALISWGSGSRHLLPWRQALGWWRQTHPIQRAGSIFSFDLTAGNPEQLAKKA